LGCQLPNFARRLAWRDQVALQQNQAFDVNAGKTFSPIRAASTITVSTHGCDVTERKSEEQVAKSEDLTAPSPWLKPKLRLMPTHVLHWSDETYRMFGMPQAGS
jgi:hypothetical protein